MKKLLYLFLFLIPLFSKAQTRTGVIFYDDCEASDKPKRYGTATTNTANFSLGYSWFNFLSPNYVQRSSVTARKGNFAYYHYITDLPGSEYNGYEWVKAELNWGYAPAGVPSGTDGTNNRTPSGLNWFAYSTFIPTSNPDNTSITSLGFTMKAWPDNYTTPSYLAMERGRYYMFITRINTSNAVVSNLKLDCGPVVKGIWVDWAIQRNFTNQDSGYIRIYKNKQLIHTVNGGNWKTGTAWAKEPFFLIGNYKWAFRTDWFEPPGTTYTDMYTDEIRIGNYSSNLESVSPDMAGGVVNQPPIVNAGPFTEYTNNTTSFNLAGTASDPDGTISTRLWTQISGPNTATFSSTSVNNPTVSNLIPGLYKFRFTVTDNSLATSFSEVDIKINKLPTIIIQSQTDYQNNTDSVRLSFTVNDPDGTVTAFLVERLSGPAIGTFSNPNAVTTDYTDLVPGDYILKASATDNTGETAIIEFELRIRNAARIRINKISKIKKNG